LDGTARSLTDSPFAYSPQPGPHDCLLGVTPGRVDSTTIEPGPNFGSHNRNGENRAVTRTTLSFTAMLQGVCVPLQPCSHRWNFE